MNSYEYIAEVKRANGLNTDYQAAKMLGCGQNKITQYKNGQSMDNETARQIAEILEVPIMGIIADMEVMRAKTEPTRKAWKVLAKMSKEAGTISPILLILLPFSIILGRVFCILCKIGYEEPPLQPIVSNYTQLA